MWYVCVVCSKSIEDQYGRMNQSIRRRSRIFDYCYGWKFVGGKVEKEFSKKNGKKENRKGRRLLEGTIICSSTTAGYW